MLNTNNERGVDVEIEFAASILFPMDAMITRDEEWRGRKLRICCERHRDVTHESRKYEVEVSKDRT